MLRRNRCSSVNLIMCTMFISTCKLRIFVKCTSKFQSYIIVDVFVYDIGLGL